MKNLIFAALLGCAVATPAFAEDGDWSGPYAGISAGYSGAKSATTTALSGSWASESQALRDDVTGKFAANQSVNDIAFGAQLGYNYQTGGAVLGLEAEFSLLNGESVSTRGPLATTPFPALSYTYTNRVDPKHMFALKAKVGAAMGKALIYAEGGWASAKADLGADIVSNGGYSKSGRLSKSLNGFIIGGGVEYRMSDSVSARLSYDYADLGDASYVNAYNSGSAFAPPGLNYTETMTQNLRLHLVRVGINFHF